MKAFFATHPVLKWTSVSFVGLLVLLALVLALFDWNALRGPIARIITAKTGHPTSIDGNLSAHIWSWEPTFTIEGLNIRNPVWAERPQMVDVQKITVQISLRELLRGKIVLPRLELTAPRVSLEREKSGRASWDAENQAPAPTNASPHIPAVRRLIIQNGEIHVIDRIRKLSFNGTMVADEQANTENAFALQLRCTGSLNGRTFKLQADGGPLINIDPNKPYHFTVDVTAGDIALALQASIPKPFDLAAYDAKFDLSGADLADAYYLTNLALPNTAKYHLEGTLHHQGNEFRINDFRGTVGSSDLRGTVGVMLGEKRPKLTATLTSTRLDIADLAPTLGNRAPVKAGLSPTPAAAGATPAAAATLPAAAAQSGWLLPDADLQVNRVRGMDADVNFNAQSVLSTKVPLKHVRFHLLLNDGVLRMDPLSFALTQGQFAGTVRINAAAAVPESDIDMSLESVDLAQFASASSKQPPLQGLLAGRVKLHGTGESVHKFASSADGSVSLVIPHGEIRSVLAELTGINVAKGLGLLLAKDQQQAELRCGVAAFEADKGQLNAQTIVMDTTNVLITGHGNINLQNERIDLAVQGDPKKIRLLRLRTPIKVGGTLLKPHVGIEAAKTILQAGAGTVLAALLTPVAAVLAFIDPGLAKNADCSALLAQASPSQ
jgi:AsmA family protein